MWTVLQSFTLFKLLLCPMQWSSDAILILHYTFEYIILWTKAPSPVNSDFVLEVESPVTIKLWPTVLLLENLNLGCGLNTWGTVILSATTVADPEMGGLRGQHICYILVLDIWI